MADDERLGEPAEDDEDIELTLEQQEALRKTMDRVQRSLVPKSGFKLPPTAQLIPGSVLKNITALSAYAETQQALVSNAIKPFLDSQAAWKKTFSVIVTVTSRNNKVVIQAGNRRITLSNLDNVLFSAAVGYV
ncbi:hypothetical protein [Kibdelosporangium aridum]|uniref:Uncharacterized protein n=1 Tax=Kibdelosporangium aridum TaxID=2030 RepID=A0A1W2FVU3_KIBAR|nr:hypothetical protein [Kibdelosporangium aridum]SMD26040.1 hypothetical protein SAMN05661093_09618 [Kibdelosporangium aridum]